jgi:hypothetical protein
LNNVTTNLTLYLLSSTAGIYTSFQVVSLGNQIIPGAIINLTRTIDGSDVVVGNGVTDAAGIVIFWVNPNYDHVLRVYASGFTPYVATLKPTQTFYTITLGGGGYNFMGNYSADGVSFLAAPWSGGLKPGPTNFTLSIFTNRTDFQSCKMELLNGTRSVIALVSGCNSTGGNISILNWNFNTSLMYGRYSVQVNGSWIVLEGDAQWKNITINGTDSNMYNTLKSAMQSLMSSSDFGTDAQTADFSRITFIFLVLAISLAILNFYTGYDTAYPGSVFWIITILAVIGAMVNGVTGKGLFYLDGATNFGGDFSQIVNNWLIPVHFVLILLIYYFTTARRYQAAG